MPVVTIELRCSLNVSNERLSGLRTGDVGEFDALTEDLKVRLKAERLVVDDIDDTQRFPIVLRVQRD